MRSEIYNPVVAGHLATKRRLRGGIDDIIARHEEAKAGIFGGPPQIPAPTVGPSLSPNIMPVVGPGEDNRIPPSDGLPQHSMSRADKYGGNPDMDILRKEYDRMKDALMQRYFVDDTQYMTLPDGRKIPIGEKRRKVGKNKRGVYMAELTKLDKWARDNGLFRTELLGGPSLGGGLPRPGGV